MSRFLNEPLTEKSSNTFEASELGLKIGVSCMQGWRETMEDAELIEPQLPGKKAACLAIFDGHGGDFIAKKTAENILKHLVATEGYKKYDAKDPYQLVSALSEAFLSTDEMLRGITTDGSADEVGCTGLVIIVTETHVFSANVGDSRCILSQKDSQTPIQMSLDHKPDHEAEKLRIIAAGGNVFRGRVCGGVAVSRGFGDFWFKRNEENNPDKKPWEHLVIAEPCVNIHPRSPLDEFLVLCCDGIYDVMSNEQVQKFVRDKLAEGKSPKEVSELLMDECLHKGSRDNMSVIIALLKK
ncbi:Aste57867_10043 [Aphanomyces stellatus]|uniref:Aste57867_10043 protein n=1 Tax=Aphanomyces stellatus TaxID=120398 RepID=A0A485KQA9_9STRA|nr:hypothetical protein As57867_010004 [Aphanomyces stellatus]VFT86920.1 Aste57867_10043 [Aphanomyces stellatus]